ncbi:MAG: IclR family transcriptional regulator [Thermovirga sp.]
MAKTPLVQSVNRAIDILELLNQERSLGITQISQTVGLEKTTVFRLLQTLCARGYVRQDLSTQSYSETMKLFEMGIRIVDSHGLLKKARPHIEALAMSTRETVNLAVLDGRNIVYVDKVESTEVIKADLGVGKSFPAYATSLGKSILALLKEDQLEVLYGGEIFTSLTSRTVPDLEALKAQIREIRIRGYASDDEELVNGLSCVAAAIRDFKGTPVAAISAAFPSYRFPIDSPERLRMAGLIKRAAQSISIELGFLE